MKALCIIAVIVSMIAALMIGCVGILKDKPDQRLALEFAVDTAAVLAGKMLAEKHPELVDQTLTYLLVLGDGDIDTADLNMGLEKLRAVKADPFLIDRVITLGKMIGASLTADGYSFADAAGMDKDLLKIAVNGFAAGMEMASQSEVVQG